MEVYGYVAMLFVGGALGLIGGGGAILTVPIMVYLFGQSPILATSYSLFIVGVSSIFGVWRYHQKALVEYATAVNFALPSFLGTYLARRVLLPNIPEIVFQLGDVQVDKSQFVMMVFALVMLGASISMIRGRKVDSPSSQKASRNYLLLALLGLAVGFVAGFVGAGGGFLIIPALVVFGGMPMASAVGTSLLIIAANSLFGFSGDLLAATIIDWGFLVTVTIISLFGILAGTYAAGFVPASKLKSGFGWFVLLMGSYILVTQLRG